MNCDRARNRREKLPVGFLYLDYEPNKLWLRIRYAIRENTAAYLIRLLAIVAYVAGSIYVSRQSGDIALAA